MKSLYKLADDEIRECILDYLKLADDSNGFSNIESNHLDTDRKSIIVLSAINAPIEDLSPKTVVTEWERRRAIPFDVEAGISSGVYANLRSAGIEYLEQVKRSTNNFSEWSPLFIQENPHTLPLLQHLSGIFSKSSLKKHVGSVSDLKISKPASVRLAQLLTERVVPEAIREGEILKRLESTLEGIVRDLVGRVMLESIVDNALRKVSVPFKREEEYSKLEGVVYSFRADFVVPNEESPKAFIEVRKSSSRHASLYAKDKMFSAINWKGKHKKMLAILVVDGEWTAETLKVMSKVFDYVVPLANVNDLAKSIKDYLDGDETKLKWIINFSIEGK